MLPSGRRAIPLLGFLYVFHIPIHEVTNKLGFFVITVLHPPLGQASYLLARILTFFSSHSPIDELTKKYNFSPLPSYTPPLGQAGDLLLEFL